MVKFITVLFLIPFLFLTIEKVEAKVLPQAKSGSKTNIRNLTPNAVTVSPRLRGDKKALNVYYSNLQNASSVSYLLTYKTASQDEGAMGTLNSKTSNTSVELLFGTCSKNVCRYHTGIHDAKLDVSYTTKTGKKYIKRYRIKI
ncbi:hypothetical protein HY384_00535 [Candidatus Daviesbacteria bacterium]|nr:hypothetical protein [Candidatus Daviesbacteria bacterium]